MKSSIAIVFFTIAMIFAGCSGGGGITSSSGDLVTSNVTALAQEGALGDKAVIFLNNSGFDVTRHPVRVLSELDQGQFWMEIVDDVVVGPGFSGSPVVVRVNGQEAVWGPLFSGFGGNNKKFAARYIGQMTDIPRSREQGMELMPMACNVIGLSPEWLNWLKSRDSSFAPFRLNDRVSGRTGRSRGGDIPIAGRSLAVNYLRGDYITIAAIGTFTVFQDGRWLVFGHPLDWVGERRLPVSLAWVDDVVTEIGSFTFKFAHPVDESTGTLTQDRETGCSVRWGNPAPVTGLETKVVLQDGSIKNFHHDMAKFGGIVETYIAATGLVFPLNRALNQIGAGNATVRLMVQVEGGDPEVFEEEISGDDLTFAIADWVVSNIFLENGQSLQKASITITVE